MSPQDLIIAVALLLGVGYGYVLGRTRVMGALLGLYAGYAVMQVAGPQVLSFLAHHHVLGQGSFPFLQLVILWVVTLLFVYRFDVGASVGKSHGLMSHVLTAIFGALVAALAATLTISLLQASGQSWDQSRLASFLQDWRVVWISLPLVVWFGLTFLRRY